MPKSHVNDMNLVKVVSYLWNGLSTEETGLRIMLQKWKYYLPGVEE
jgi:hypothetical protein